MSLKSHTQCVTHMPIKIIFMQQENCKSVVKIINHLAFVGKGWGVRIILSIEVSM